jgi:hypothetical protein
MDAPKGSKKAGAAKTGAELPQTINTAEPPRVGGILAAFHRSPMVGADFDLTRSFETGRKIDL